MTGLPTSPPRLSKHPLLIILVSSLVFAVFFFSPPVTVLDKTRAIGYAICHQIPARSLYISGTALPLCARCTGIYLGVLVGLAGMILMGRFWANDLPPGSVLLTLVGFIGVMGFDGINSYLAFFPSLPHLYEPQNWLRLTTGTLYGLAISLIVFPIINGTLWHPSRLKHEPVVQSLIELLPFLAGVAIIILVVLWRHPPLLYPLAILSTMGVMITLGMINTALVVVLTRCEGCARSWRELALAITMGLAVSFLLIGGMDWLRATLIRAPELPY
jgi:uncharacterized membrane protein